MNSTVTERVWIASDRPSKRKASGFSGFFEEGVDLVRVSVVVGGGPAQAVVESADDREGASQTKITVEIQDSGNRHVGLIVSGGVGEVGVSDQNGVSGSGPLGPEGPGIGPDVGISLLFPALP